jgi:hypothetical protein
MGGEEAVTPAHAVSVLSVHCLSMFELEHGFAAIHMNRLSSDEARLF